MDVLTPEQRHRNMANIKGRDTKPEKVVRSAIHRLGFRYRLHARELPGKPDIVFRKARKVIFVHGCFWHTHDCRFGRVEPQTNSEFWRDKRAGTQRGDKANLERLEAEGWKVLTIWECQTRDADSLNATLNEFLAR